ncbi:MAG: hypothetical protein OXC62_00470 [Aestuariivita sp.]|nr:hypothetical protein [Aestuariivita sp.]
MIRTEFGFVDEDAMEELWEEYELQDLWAANDTLKNLMASDFAGLDVNKLLGNLDALTNMLLRLRGNRSIPRPQTNALDIHEFVMEVSDQAPEFAEAAETIERLCRPLETLLTEECQEIKKNGAMCG